MMRTFGTAYLPQYLETLACGTEEQNLFYMQYDRIYTDRKRRKRMDGFIEARKKKPFEPICFVKFSRTDCGTIFFSPMSFCDWQMPGDKGARDLIFRNVIIRRMRKSISFRYSQKEAERYLRRLGIGVDTLTDNDLTFGSIIAYGHWIMDHRNSIADAFDWSIVGTDDIYLYRKPEKLAHKKWVAHIAANFGVEVL